jgi:hypothetical protein
MEIKHIAGKKHKNIDSLSRLLTLAAAAWTAVKNVKKNSLKLPLKKQLQNDPLFGNIYRHLK